MKHWVELMCYSEGGKTVFRQQYPLPDITPEEFNPGVHMARLFNYPESHFDNSGVNKPFVKIWEVAIPETKEEEAILVSMGKWSSNTLDSIINQQ